MFYKKALSLIESGADFSVCLNLELGDYEETSNAQMKDWLARDGATDLHELIENRRLFYYEPYRITYEELLAFFTQARECGRAVCLHAHNVERAFYLVALFEDFAHVVYLSRNATRFQSVYKPRFTTLDFTDGKLFYGYDLMEVPNIPMSTLDLKGMGVNINAPDYVELPAHGRKMDKHQVVTNILAKVAKYPERYNDVEQLQESKLLKMTTAIGGQRYLREAATYVSADLAYLD
jgi:hypothetical protein